ncbi:hypothetical protein N7535_009262 [Penicillium sp. DV-2018c]|nr:hypothetical protein N7535_009262 [Penicillium sp. DV-2018c]
MDRITTDGLKLRHLNRRLALASGRVGWGMRFTVWTRRREKNVRLEVDNRICRLSPSSTGK